jgi:hypothetical protein
MAFASCGAIDRSNRRNDAGMGPPYLRKVTHPKAHDNYRVILKDNGAEIKIGSMGIQFDGWHGFVVAVATGSAVAATLLLVARPAEGSNVM